MTVVLKSRSDFSLDTYRRAAWQGEAVQIHDDARKRMRESRDAFMALIDNDPDLVVYGVTSGYGQNAYQRLTRSERKDHAGKPGYSMMTSFGEPLPERVTRGIVLARLTNYVEGHAAITPALAVAVAAMLDGGPLPPVPALGNGCPGEILALGHLLLPLSERFAFAEKDSLALVNGSPCATALIADAALAAQQRLALAIEVFALSIEAFQAPMEAYDEALDNLWDDAHETAVLRQLRHWLDGAEGKRRPYQAPVTWRIMPRVLGQARRAVSDAEEVARISLRAVSDNPVFLPPDAEHPEHPKGRVLSNGGFHNGKAYPALDNLAAAWADLALLCDRQVTKLLDGKVSLLPHQLMENDGYMGCLGFTALGYAEQARQAAQRSFLPGSEGGGFGQNDVAVPTFYAWRKEAEAGRCLDANLAALAAVASQAFHITGRAIPPRLQPFLQGLRDIFPPVTSSRVLGPETEKLQLFISEKVYAGAPVGQ